ncbi:enoyl-CoA hydratase [Roseiarcus fermentans]|uniref:3-hydroxyisobutyryl-CoA hydrolase n=1 Tax=Roseiarcus fermentans TaxID=1473586 RepID=A0A366FIU7_9HYPH|nr:enoyl-CoA hydratase/isomerase family protein [Roseiarcus fermentans]RBP14036.1 enoyl-CoA hydratase [Roseiarcus fermentans]
MSGDAEALTERRGAAGVVVLNRPKALNALTLTMVRRIAAALDAWEDDPLVTRVVITGAGDKAFCAGGDIRRLYELGRAGDHAGQLTFWREEYQLNARIRTYPKPVVALIDGIVMGGGVGVSINARHRVAGGRFSFAMPEVGIGFFPDVGGTFFLPRLSHRAGVYLALTGLRADAGDALAFGLAEMFAPSAAMGPLAAALESPDDVGATLARFASPPPQSALMDEADGLEACFAPDSREAIVAALEAAERRGLAFAAPARAAMLAKSPTSQAIALRQMALGATVDFDEALRVEFRIVSRLCRGHDFYEGVRALIVDKDNRPMWSPRPSAAELDGYFAPLGDDELTLPNR